MYTLNCDKIISFVNQWKDYFEQRFELGFNVYLLCSYKDNTTYSRNLKLEVKSFEELYKRLTDLFEHELNMTSDVEAINYLCIAHTTYSTRYVVANLLSDYPGLFYVVDDLYPLTLCNL